jgi:hypothetical protein
VQIDLHLALQNKHPLGRGGAMKRTRKPNGAVAQLVALTGHQGRQLGLRLALIQSDELFFEQSLAALGGVEHGLFECGHGQLGLSGYWGELNA